MAARFLLLLALVFSWACPAAAGPWPFRSTHSVALGDSVVAVQRVWHALIRQPLLSNECHGSREAGRKHWKWTLTGTRFYLYDQAGHRLAPHGYDLVGRTAQGLIYGVVLAKGNHAPATYEAVSPTGKVTPLVDFRTGYPPSDRLYYRYRKKRD